MGKDAKDKNLNLNEEVLKARAIIVAEPISPELSKNIFYNLTIINQRSTTKPIYIYINSPGGCADSGFAIHDMLKFISNPIITICSGLCASAAVMVFLAADKGKNYSLPHSRFLLHQPSTQTQGRASDIEITASEINKIKLKYNEIVSQITGKPVDKLAKDMNRDFWLSPEEAVKYKLASKIISQSKEIESEG